MADRDVHKVMTATEYLAADIKGWHEVCWNVDGFGNVGVRYLGTGDGEFERGKDVGRAIGWDAAKRDTSKSLGTDQ